jgi:adenine deaminase
MADPNRDLAKLAVIERHHRTGNVGLGFVQGLGIQKGAIASSVAREEYTLRTQRNTDQPRTRYSLLDLRI